MRRILGIESFRTLSFLGIALAIALLVFSIQVAWAAGPAPIQIYYVPLPADELNKTFDAIDASYPINPDISEGISIAIAGDGTFIYYDEWEDGFDSDVTIPNQSTTKIWCDNDTGNGAAPGFPSDDCGGGDAIILANDIPIPRNSVNIFYDGGDKILSNFPIAVTKAAYPLAPAPGSLLAGATEVLNTDEWGSFFTAPVGENVTNPGDYSGAFTYTALAIMASEDGTTLTLPDSSTTTLNEGHTYVVNNIQLGDTVFADLPIQAHLLTGRRDSQYQMRWYSLTPTEEWCCDYYTPVGDDASGGGNVGPTKVWLYNPGSSDITVNYDFLGGSSPDGTVTVPAGLTALSPAIPDGSGARFFSSGASEPFFALTQTDTAQGSFSSGQIFDWGHPLVPVEDLTYQALVGMGVGNTSNSAVIPSRSVVWVAPVTDADIYVDRDGDGIADATFLNTPALSSLKIIDPVDQDMTGALIYASTPGGTPGLDRVDIVVAWGQNPELSFSGDDEALDLGTLVPSLPVIAVGKFSTLAVDVNQDGLINTGDTLEYSIGIVNFGHHDFPANSFLIEDFTVPMFFYTTYVPDSTTFDSGSGANPFLDDAVPTVFPLDEGGVLNPVELPIGDTHTFTFEATVNPITILDPPDGEQICDVINLGELRSTGGEPFGLFDTIDPIIYQPEIDLQKTVYRGHDGGASCPGIEEVGGNVGDAITFCFDVENTGDTFLSNVSIADAALGLNIPIAGTMAPGDVVTKYAESTILTVNDTPNTAIATGDASYVDGQEITCDQYTIEASDTATTTPVTVAYFEAASSGDHVLFDWSTATETGNAGFNIYVETENGRQKVNDTLILTHAVDSLERQDYSYEAAGLQGTEFFIEDVGVLGKSRLHGPYTLGEVYGQRVEADPIDWAALHLENDALTTQRAAANRAAVESQAVQFTSPNLFQQILTWTGNIFYSIIGQELRVAKDSAVPLVDLQVEEDGIYRVTYEDVVAVAGSSVNGIPMSDLALKNRDASVPIFVSGRTFGPGAYIEFYGEGLDTLYTGTNIYKLEVDVRGASRVSVDNSRMKRKVQMPDFYMETASIETNKKYAYQSPNGDPWYNELLAADPRIPADWGYELYELAVDNHMAGAAPVTLEVEMWGILDLIAGPEHHVLVDFNGEQVADELFDGRELQKLNIELAPEKLLENNELLLSLPNDLPLGVDMVAVERVSVTYPRAFQAQDDSLSFDTKGDAVQVRGLTSEQVVAYRVQDGTAVKLGRINIEEADGGTFAATLIGSKDTASFVVSTEDALLSPMVSLTRIPGKLTNTEPVDFLIISHPNFISGLQPLVDAREAQGMSVMVVNVEDIYDEYSGGIFDALAIKEYIKDAVETMGVQYVLLVGGDTVDYRDYVGDSINYIPSLYAQTVPEVQFAAVDPMYTDLDDDGVPNAAIGRFPVRNLSELTIMVNKTLQYAKKDQVADPYGQTAVFAADEGFEKDSDSFIAGLSAGWTADKAYKGYVGEDAAKSALVHALNQGVALTSYVGHSGPTEWAQNWFSTRTLEDLEPNNRPTIITQWGCWNSYYVDPSRNTLGPAFLLTSEEQGAAAVTGSTTLTLDSSERALGRIMMPKLVTPGKSVGAAMQEAKVELAQEHPEMVDVLLGWTLLGDPTIVIEP